MLLKTMCRKIIESVMSILFAIDPEKVVTLFLKLDNGASFHVFHNE